MTDWLSKAQREALCRHIGEIPDLVKLVEIATSGTLAGIDLLDTRHKMHGRIGLQGPVEAVDLEQWARREPGKTIKGIPEYDTRTHTDGHLEDLDADAKGRRVGVLRCLESWVRLAAEEMTDEGAEHVEPASPIDAWVATADGEVWPWAIGGPTITTEAGWLAMHMDWICEQQWVIELEQDVTGIWHDLRKVVREDRPEYRPRCTKCGNRMRDETSYYTCLDCGWTERASAMDIRTDLATGKPLTAYDFLPFGLTAAQVQKWFERGLIEKATGQDGKPIKRGKRDCYWPLDVLRIAETMKGA